MRAAVLLLLLASPSACGSAPPPPPIVPDAPPPPPLAVVEEPSDALPGREDLPRSIRRLVGEQRDEVRSIAALAAELRDRHGRERALREADALSQELSGIEAALGSTDSESLDQVVVRLQRLATKTALIHDALQQAAL